MSIVVELADGQDPEAWVDRITDLCKHRRHWWQFWRSKHCAIVSVATVTPDEFTDGGGVAFDDRLAATRYLLDAMNRTIGERVVQRALARAADKPIGFDGPVRPWQVATIERIYNTEPRPPVNDPITKHLPRAYVRYMEDHKLVLVHDMVTGMYRVRGE